MHTNDVIEYLETIPNFDNVEYWKTYGLEFSYARYCDMKTISLTNDMTYIKTAINYWYNDFVYNSSIYVYNLIYKNELIDGKKEKEANNSAEKFKQTFQKKFYVFDNP